MARTGRPRTPLEVRRIMGTFRNDRYGTPRRQAAKVLGVGLGTVQRALTQSGSKSDPKRVATGSAATKERRAKMTKAAECELWRETLEHGDDFFGHLAKIYPGWTAEDPAAVAAAREAWRQCGASYVRHTWPRAQIYMNGNLPWAVEQFGWPKK